VYPTQRRKLDPFKSSVEFDETLHLKFSSDGIDPLLKLEILEEDLCLINRNWSTLALLKQQVRLGMI
jgi:hypothetical protein